MTTCILDIVEANRHPIAIKSKHEGIYLYYQDMEGYGGTLIGIKLTFPFSVTFNPIPSVPADWQWSTF